MPKSKESSALRNALECVLAAGLRTGVPLGAAQGLELKLGEPGPAVRADVLVPLLSQPRGERPLAHWRMPLGLGPLRVGTPERAGVASDGAVDRGHDVQAFLK